MLETYFGSYIILHAIPGSGKFFGILCTIVGVLSVFSLIALDCEYDEEKKKSINKFLKFSIPTIVFSLFMALIIPSHDSMMKIILVKNVVYNEFPQKLPPQMSTILEHYIKKLGLDDE